MEKFERYFQKHFSFNLKGQTVKPNGHRISASEIFKLFREAQEEAGNTIDITVDDVARYIEEKTPKVEGEGSFDIENFIKGYLRSTCMAQDGKTVDGMQPEWKIDAAFRQIETINNGNPIPSDMLQLQAAIRAFAIKQGLGKAAKADDIKTVLADMARRKGAELISGIITSIKYDPACIKEGDMFLQELHDLWDIKERQEVLNAAMRHFLWQVKRKLRGLPVSWPIWLNYYGGAGIGKTSMINSIGAPLKDFAILTSIAELLDEERQVMKLCSTYYINIDEISVETKNPYTDDGTLTKGQNAALKKLLTQEKSRTRNMGGQSQSTRRYTFSVISSANEHLYDIIYDEKTMRRYFEVECRRITLEDYGKLDELKTHIMALWKSVDENRELGYLYPGCDVWDEVKDAQSKYYPTNTNTRYWIEDERVVCCDESERESLRDMYDSYKSYCKEHGNVPKQYRKWSTDVRHLVQGCGFKNSDPINVKCLGSKDDE